MAASQVQTPPTRTGTTHLLTCSPIRTDQNLDHFHSQKRVSVCPLISVAVNFWYDMEYDIKYNYFQLLESLCDVKG